MGKIRGITDSEKELINVIGRLPESSPKELVKNLERFKQKDIVWGAV